MSAAAATTAMPLGSSSSSSSSSISTSSSLVSSSTSPCAACKLLRRKCTKECVFSPYFPPNEPVKFAHVHKIFGASNVSKMLQELPEERRRDAVASIVYEAHARIRDPVYGCLGAIFTLQQQIVQLRKQLSAAQSEIVCLKFEYQQQHQQQQQQQHQQQQQQHQQQQQQQQQSQQHVLGQPSMNSSQEEQQQLYRAVALDNQGTQQQQQQMPYSGTSSKQGFASFDVIETGVWTS